LRRRNCQTAGKLGRGETAAARSVRAGKRIKRGTGACTCARIEILAGSAAWARHVRGYARRDGGISRPRTETVRSTPRSSDLPPRRRTERRAPTRRDRVGHGWFGGSCGGNVSAATISGSCVALQSSHATRLMSRWSLERKLVLA
jgi:hypothetical protein